MADVSTDYVQGPGGYYRRSDRSGPYSIGADGEATLLTDDVAGAKFAKIAASSSGNNALVAAVAGKKLRVLGYNLSGAGAVNVKFQQDGGGTPVDLTGLKHIAAAGGEAGAGFSPAGWFETAAGKSLDLNLSGAVVVGGELVYVEAA